MREQLYNRPLYLTTTIPLHNLRSRQMCNGSHLMQHGRCVRLALIYLNLLNLPVARYKEGQGRRLYSAEQSCSLLLHQQLPGQQLLAQLLLLLFGGAAAAVIAAAAAMTAADATW